MVFLGGFGGRSLVFGEWGGELFGLVDLIVEVVCVCVLFRFVVL